MTSVTTSRAPSTWMTRTSTRRDALSGHARRARLQYSKSSRPMAEAIERTQCPAWVNHLNIWTDQELHRDPYPRYAELRGCPLGRSEELGGYWVASRYEDVLAVLQDAECF